MLNNHVINILYLILYIKYILVHNYKIRYIAKE
jgi:hypothetical protein